MYINLNTIKRSTTLWKLNEKMEEGREGIVGYNEAGKHTVNTNITTNPSSVTGKATNWHILSASRNLLIFMKKQEQ